MDETTQTRKRRLQALIDSPTYAGSNIAFAAAVGINKSRVSQLLDPAMTFGERAAKNICDALGLPDRYFDEHTTDQKTSLETLTLGSAVVVLPHLQKDEAGMFERYLNGELEPKQSHEVWAMPSYFDGVPVFALTIDDDVMEPLIQKGSQVIIGVGVPHQSGDKVFIRENGTWLIRRLLIDGELLYIDSPRTPSRPLTGELVGPVVSVNMPTMNLAERMKNK